MIDREEADGPLSKFSQTSEQVAGEVIRAYSTSFGLSTRLLGKQHRVHVRNIYALVRVADEIVDGVAREAGLGLAEQREALARYEEETHRAIKTGYSPDLVIHAFVRTAREARFGRELTEPFFASMRADLAEPSEQPAVFDGRAHAAYVHGSAEVIGVMCLRVFVRHSELSEEVHARLEHGARRLGAAFQNINFLRDLADDTARLGRSYLGVTDRMSDSDRDRWVGKIRAQLADAELVIPLIPADARAAVRSAAGIFSNLTERIARTPAEELYRSRVRVPNLTKLRIAARAVATTLRERSR